MKLIRKSVSKAVMTASGNARKRTYGLFYCPGCEQEVERDLQNGKRSLSCGSSACKDSHPIEGATKKRNPIYTAHTYMKSVAKSNGIPYPDDWEDFAAFFEDIGQYKTIGSQLCRHDLGIGYSKENCYWKGGKGQLNPALFITEGAKPFKRKVEMHGMYGTRPYGIWSGMKTRCYSTGNKGYERYGAKGITICAEWKDSFQVFWDDMKEGYTKDLTIDRIDSTKGYYKDNCRWLTLAENSGRSRATKVNQVDKATGSIIKTWPTLREAGTILGIDPSSMTKVCKGKKKSAGGFHWQYA